MPGTGVRLRHPARSLLPVLFFVGSTVLASGIAEPPAAAQQTQTTDTFNTWTSIEPAIFGTEVCDQGEGSDVQGEEGSTTTTRCWNEKPDLRGVFVHDAKNMWAVGDAPVFENRTPNDEGETEVEFDNKQDALIVRTNDGGGNWELEESDTVVTDAPELADVNRLDDIVFASSGVAYAVGRRKAQNTSSEQVVVAGTVTRDQGRLAVNWRRTRTKHILDEKDSLRAISCSDKDHCFSVGYPQLVVTTRDGWKEEAGVKETTKTGPFEHLTAVALLDGPPPAGKDCPPACYGYVVALNGVIATRDGGQTWNQQFGFPEAVKNNTDVCSNTCQNDLWFADYSTGYAVVGAQIFATRDAGDTWVQQISPSTSTLHSIACSSKTTCWAVGTDGTIVFTSDGGRRWLLCNDEQPEGPCHNPSGIRSGLNEVAVANDPLTGLTTVMAVGDDGAVLKLVTTISGTSQPLNDVSCADSGHCHVVGEDGTVLATTDGGRSWERQEAPSTSTPDLDALEDLRTHLEGVSFTDRQRGHAVGERTILSTADGGRQWESQAFPPLDAGGSGMPATNVPASLHDVAFVDGPGCENSGAPSGFDKGCYGFAVGRGGTVIATKDGGRSWVQQRAPGAGNDLNAVAFADHTHGYAVGKGGAVIATSNGTDWTTESGAAALVGGKDLEDVFVTPDGDVYAVGEDAVILASKSGEGGPRIWEVVSRGVAGGQLSGIAFANSDEGIAVGRAAPGRPLILQTRDRGQTWTPRPPPELPDDLAGLSLTGVSYRKTLTTGVSAAFLVGKDGMIIKLVEASAPRLPSVTSILPNTGPAQTATPVVITGENLAGATRVSFGTVDVVPTGVGDSLLQAEAPPQEAGTVEVRVTVEEAKSNPVTFTYLHAVSEVASNPPVQAVASGLPAIGLNSQPPQVRRPAASSRRSRAAAASPQGRGIGEISVPPAPPGAAAPAGLPRFSPVMPEPITRAPRPSDSDVPSLASVATVGAVVAVALLALFLAHRIRPGRLSAKKASR